jgi:hypothetical protein
VDLEEHNLLIAEECAIIIKLPLHGVRSSFDEFVLSNTSQLTIIKIDLLMLGHVLQNPDDLLQQLLDDVVLLEQEHKAQVDTKHV